jgi:hypothetical protein
MRVAMPFNPFRGMAGRAVRIEESLSHFGIAHNDGRRPHTARIAARNFELMYVGSDIGDVRRNVGRLTFSEVELQRALADSTVSGAGPV